MRRVPVAVPLLVAAAVVLAGCSGTGASTTADRVSAERTSTPSATPTTASPSAASTGSPSPSPSPTQTTPPPPSYDVVAVQKQLQGTYYVGPVDGEPGPALRSAVMAFQKVQGLGADGVVGPATLAALAAPKAPQLKASSPANRVEVDLTKQVLYVVKGGAVARVLPVSSGNGATYKQKDGSTARALTPTGWYTIQRRIVGERHADLGILYDPQYFYRGWAIHGSNSVPAGPASHGCVRVTRWDAKWLLGQINNGTSVYLYGGKHVFSAGSSAAGTDDPSGDTVSAPAPAEEPKSEPTKQSPSTTPTTASPSPSATKKSASPSPSPSLEVP